MGVPCFCYSVYFCRNNSPKKSITLLSSYDADTYQSAISDSAIYYFSRFNSKNLHFIKFPLLVQWPTYLTSLHSALPGRK